MDSDILAAQQCLSEHSSGHEWTPTGKLGEGAHTKAIGLTGPVAAVLLIDRHPPSKDPTAMQSRHSQKGIQRLLAAAGLPVPETLVDPFFWTGGSATICPLMPGKDISQSLAAKEHLDPTDLASQVAMWVDTSMGISELKPQSGVGWHFLGHNPQYTSNSEAFSKTLEFMKGKDTSLDETITKLGGRAARILDKAPIQTMIFDVCDRNVMISEGKAVGFVDNTDLYTGDPMFAPGFAFGMLSLVKWEGLEAYKEQWMQQCGATSEDEFRCQLHELASQARVLGREWTSVGTKPEGVDKWHARASEMAAQMPLSEDEILHLADISPMEKTAARRAAKEISQPSQNYPKIKNKQIG